MELSCSSDSDHEDDSLCSSIPTASDEDTSLTDSFFFQICVVIMLMKLYKKISAVAINVFMKFTNLLSLKSSCVPVPSNTAKSYRSNLAHE